MTIYEALEHDYKRSKQPLSEFLEANWWRIAWEVRKRNEIEDIKAVDDTLTEEQVFLVRKRLEKIDNPMYELLEEIIKEVKDEK